MDINSDYADKADKLRPIDFRYRFMVPSSNWTGSKPLKLEMWVRSPLESPCGLVAPTAKATTRREHRRWNWELDFCMRGTVTSQ